MQRLSRFFRRQRLGIYALTLLQAFFMAGGAEAVEARQQGILRAQAEDARMARTFGLTPEQWRVDDTHWSLPGWLERSASVVAEEAHEILDHSRMEVARLLDETRQPETPVASMAQVSRAVAQDGGPVGSGLEAEARPKRQIKPYIPRRPALEAGEGERTVAGAPRSAKLLPGLGGSTEDDLPLRVVQRKAQTVDASALPPSQRISSAVAPASPRAQGVKSNKSIAPEIVALAASLDNSPSKIFRYVHDQITYDPKWGVDSTPLGTLWEGRGTSWDQAWLLQELLTAAGVDARLEWGQVEIPPSLLTNLTGIDDPVRAGDFLTTAGLEVLLVIQGSQVAAARFPHVWVKAHLDYIPNRGVAQGTADTWIRMDPSITTHERTDGLRLDQDVPFVLGDHLLSGTELSPRQDYEAALLAHVADQGLPVANFDDAKSLHQQVADDFPFVPGTLRAKIVSAVGESETVPAAFEQDVEVQIREEGGGALLSWTTTASALYGKRLETVWLGATSSDQAALDLYGGIFATPPYEVDLRPTLRLDGVEVASGTSIGSAEDAEIQLTLTPPDGSGAGDGIATVAGWDLFAGEHGVLSLDYGRAPPELADRFAQEALNAGGNNFEEEGWKLAQAASTYLHALGGDLTHLVDLSWHRLLTFNTAVFAVKRGAVSTSPDGTPQTFSPGPLALDVGAMPLAVMPVDGVQTSTVPTLELLGSQGSFREGEALAGVFGGEHLTAVTFLTRAVREGQVVTNVDLSNLDAALADSEISSDAKGAIRYAVEQLGMEAWISETQIESNTFQTTGYILIDPSTGSGGYFVTFERRFTPLDGAVTFHNPIDLDTVTAPTDVIASIDAEGIESWTLSARPVGGSGSTVIATGSGPVDNTVLGQFDPTLLLNDLYDLVLTGLDAAGQPVTGKINIRVDGQMKVGNFSLSFTDLRMPLAGLDIEVVRTYDSRDKEQGDFGFGWTLRMRQGKYVNNRRPGDGWQINGGTLPCQSAQETTPHLTAVRLSDTESYLFRLRLSSLAPTLGGCFGYASFEYLDGPAPATLSVVGNDEFFWENNGNRLVDVDTLEVFEPQAVKLVTKDGRVFFVDLDVGVTRLEEPSGRSVDISPSGITHSSGQGIDFTRDGEGRITKIVDPRGGELIYEYDAAGDLVRTVDSEGAPTTFTYGANHYLEDFYSPLGDRVVRTEYDDDGRMVRMIDAKGQVVEFEHDLEGRRDVIVDRLGFAQVLEYDNRGNIIREVDEVGAVRLNAFDDQDNLISHTDPLGRVTTFEYNDRNDVTKIVDPTGTTLQLTYNAFGEVTSLLDPLGQTTTIQYNAGGRPLTATDAVGSATQFVYGGHGEVESMTDVLGRVSTFQYDAAGRVIHDTDPMGFVTETTYDASGNVLTESLTRTLPSGLPQILTTTYTYDAMGRETSTTLPDGSQTQVGYDDLGRKTSFTDPLGRVTSFDYDSQGQLTAIAYPDGTSESWTYDVEGRLSSSTDRAGRATTMVYDPAGRMTELHLPDGSVERSTYDAAGQLTSTTNRRGQTTTFTYDAAGRQTQVEDALGQSVQMAYDGLGRVTQITDRRGQTTRYFYDGLGRWKRTLYSDDSEQHADYDAAGRLISTTDPAGRAQTFAYDDLDRLISITDPLDGVTAYTYDELGNRTSITDANGRTTRLEYDSRGRITARVLPDGARETMSYRVDGSLASHTDFNGQETTYSYDAAGRPIQRAYADGSLVNMTFTLSGRRATDQSSLGTTTYDYDDLDQLVEKLDPSGQALRYTYDAVGNVTEHVAVVGNDTLSTTYTYDVLNRLQSVVDSDGGTSSMGYDANSNLTSIVHANGVQSTLTYDVLNRLTDVLTVDGDGATIDQISYAFDSGHRIESITEMGGISRSYTYDALDRLVEEEVLDGTGSLLERRAFTYDAVGNRLSRTLTAADGTSTTTDYTYDVRDRLIDDGSTQWTWDANGNLVGDSTGNVFTWDVQDRLVRWQDGSGREVRLSYDVDGNRVRTETFDAGGQSEEVGYLVDTNAFLSQVVAETDGSGILTAHFTRGAGLLSMHRPGTTGRSYYHSDALGSVRRLTDDSGAVTDSYGYSAFGVATSSTGSTENPYRYTGQRFDETLGLYDLRARWMDPEAGRFLSMDPYQGSALLPVSLHRYLYANANPVHFVDPTGRFSVAGVAVAGAALGIVSTIAVNFVLGRETTLLDIVKAGIAGAILGPLSLAFPILGAGLAVFGVFSSIGLTASVLTDPNASAGQKVGAIAILIASLVGARAGLRHYRQSVKPGTPPPPKPPPPPPKPPAPPKPPTPPPPVQTWTNLVRPDRAHHILYGESPTSGGHMWPGNPGKSTFPKDWGPDKILGVISEIATNPKLTWTQRSGPKGKWFTKKGKPAEYRVEGYWEGIKIRVVLFPGGSGIHTAFPIAP